MKARASSLLPVALFLLAGSARAEIPFHTIKGLAARAHGRCVEVTLRAGESSEADNGAFCSGSWGPEDGPGSIKDTFAGWAADFLADSLDDAERLFCGAPGCRIPRTQEVRLYLVGTSRIDFRTIETPDAVLFIVSTTMIQLIQTSNTALLDEVLKTPNTMGWTQWLQAIRSAGASSCTPLQAPHAPMPPAMLNVVFAATRMAYTFLLMHELAHLPGDKRCGADATGDAVTVEAACDAAAFRALSAKRALAVDFAPTIPYLGLAHYMRLYEHANVLAEGGHPGQSLFEVLPGALWQKRAELVISQLDAYCRAHPATDPMLCPAGWPLKVEILYRQVWIDLPQPCHDPGASAAPASFTPDPEAARCIAYGEHDLDWDKNGQPPVARMSEHYVNQCDRPVRCRARLEVGTMPRVGDDDSDFQMLSHREELFDLRPDELHLASATLEWTANAARMPSARTPRLHRELMECSFRGSADPPPAGRFCDALAKFTDVAARRAWVEARGEAIYDEQGQLENHRARSLLPGMGRCRVESDEIWCDAYRDLSGGTALSWAERRLDRCLSGWTQSRKQDEVTWARDGIRVVAKERKYLGGSIQIRVRRDD